MNKRTFFLSLLAVISLIVAIATFLWIRKIDKQLQEPTTIHLQADVPTVSGDVELGHDELQAGFDGLLSDEGVAELYAGEENYGFTGMAE